MLLPHRAGQQGAADHIRVRLVSAGRRRVAGAWSLCFAFTKSPHNKVHLGSGAQHTPAELAKPASQALKKPPTEKKKIERGIPQVVVGITGVQHHKHMCILRKLLIFNHCGVSETGFHASRANFGTP